MIAGYDTETLVVGIVLGITITLIVIICIMKLK